MLEDRNYTCCFTGHRVIEDRHRAALPLLLEQGIRALIAEGYHSFAAGGALGFDTIAAEMVLSLQQEFSQLRLIIVAPFAGQADGWARADQLRYERIRQASSDYICLAAAYTRDCMRQRNLALVGMSAACLSYCLHSRSGSGQTVGLARRENLSIVDLAAQLESLG